MSPFRGLTAPLIALTLGLAAPVATAQVVVRAATLDQLRIDVEQAAPAEVLSLARATLAAEVAGVVANVHVEVGETVDSGTLLAELEAADYRLALQAAEAELTALRAEREQARTRLDRARRLGEGDYLSADELLGRETDLAVVAARIAGAEVAVATAERNLEKTRLTAPYPATVTARPAEPGAFVTVGSPMVSVVGTERIEVDAPIPAWQADTLTSGAAPVFEADGRRWPLQLLRLSPVVDPATRSRTARLAFTGDAPPIGTAGTLRWRPDRNALPAHLLVRRNDTLGVFVVDGDSARFRPMPGAQEGRPFALTNDAGWTSSTRIVTDGRERLQDGDPIRVAD